MKYNTTINLSDTNNSHTLAYQYIYDLANGKSLMILEVGCSAGYFGSTLCQDGHRVWGVEPTPEAALAASEHLDTVFKGYLDDFLTQFPEQKFDVVVFGDVLEHLPRPLETLQVIRQRLTKNGAVIASIPNVAHLSVRAMLFEGRWEYTDLGILDRTHLQFYTRDTIIELFSDSGFAVKAIKNTKLSLADIEIATGSNCNKELAGLIESIMATDPSLDIFQYVVLAHCSDNPLSENSELYGQSKRIGKNEIEHSPVIKLNNYQTRCNATLQEQLTAQIQHSAQIQNLLEHTSQEVELLQIQLNDATVKIRTLQLDLESSQQDVLEIITSTSWKLTKPIRYFGSLVRRCFRHER